MAELSPSLSLSTLKSTAIVSGSFLSGTLLSLFLSKYITKVPTKDNYLTNIIPRSNDNPQHNNRPRPPRHNNPPPATPPPMGPNIPLRTHLPTYNLHRDCNYILLHRHTTALAEETVAESCARRGFDGDHGPVYVGVYGCNE